MKIKVTIKIDGKTVIKREKTSFPDPDRFASIFEAPKHRRIYTLPWAVFRDGDDWFISSTHGATLHERGASKLPIYIYNDNVHIWRKDYDALNPEIDSTLVELPKRLRISVHWL